MKLYMVPLAPNPTKVMLYIAEREELDAAIMRMLAADGPYLLDVKVARTDNVFPMVPAGASVSEVRLS